MGGARPMVLPPDQGEDQAPDDPNHHARCDERHISDGHGFGHIEPVTSPNG